MCMNLVYLWWTHVQAHYCAIDHIQLLSRYSIWRTSTVFQKHEELVFVLLISWWIILRTVSILPNQHTIHAVVRKRLPPLQATHLSGYVSGLGLSRLCITPSTRLKNLRSTTIQTDVPIIISSLSFFSLLFLSSSQSIISLRLLSPYAPRNETSIYLASYGSCSAISWSGISATTPTVGIN